MWITPTRTNDTHTAAYTPAVHIIAYIVDLQVEDARLASGPQPNYRTFFFGLRERRKVDEFAFALSGSCLIQYFARAVARQERDSLIRCTVAGVTCQSSLTLS